MNETLKPDEKKHPPTLVLKPDNPLTKVMEEKLFKKALLKWLMGHWMLYASESKGKEKTRIRLCCNGIGEFRVNEFPSGHSPNGKIIYQGKSIDKAVEAWFKLRD